MWFEKCGSNPRAGHIFGVFVKPEGTECTGTASMDSSFGNTLVVKMMYLQCWSVESQVGVHIMADLLPCMPILQQCRTILVFGGDCEPMVRVGYLAAPISSEPYIRVMGIFGVLGNIG